MTSIVLYGFDGSTYVRTVRMLLGEKDAHYEQVPVNVLAGEPRQPDHLARHPFGKVPVLDHDGFRIIETSAIAPYLDEVLPEPVPDAGQSQGPGADAHGNGHCRFLRLRPACYGGGLPSVCGFHRRPE
jgi:glutathione S-transferase